MSRQRGPGNPPPRVTYSINNGRRLLTVAGTLGVVAAGLFYLWHTMMPVNPGLAAVLALVLYGVLFFLYNAFLWRLPPVNRFNQIPDLRGRWTGSIRFEGDSPHDATLDILQHWSEISFELASEPLTGRATMASMNIADQAAVRVAWNYSVVGTDRMADGAIEVTLNKQEMALAGGLFDNAGRRASLTVTRQG